MDAQNIAATDFLNFYYFTYSRMISFPFMYYELVADYDMNACEVKRTTPEIDIKNTNQYMEKGADEEKRKNTCENYGCCAMKKSDLEAVLKICELTFASNLYECRRGRFPTDYYSREIAASYFDVDFDMTKSSKVLLSQFYIICKILAQKKRDKTIDSQMSLLEKWFDWYMRKSKAFFSDQTTEDDDAQYESKFRAILRCLVGEPPKSDDNFGKTFWAFIMYLDEAKHFYAKLHRNYREFIESFSRKLHYIDNTKEKKDKTGFNIHS